jgi:hypothetical protein
MATHTWTSVSSGLWSTTTNWTPNATPSTGDAVFVTQAGAYLISEPAVVTIADLTLNDASAEISVGGSLSVTSAITVTAGSVAASGTLTAAALSNAGSITNTGTLTAQNLSNTGTLLNNATNAFIYLSGTTDVQSLERIGGSGYLISGAVVNNTDGTLDASYFGSQTVMSIGTIDGGSVTNLISPGTQAGNLTIPTPELNGVTWLGTMNLTDSDVEILNGLTLTGANGSGAGTLDFGTNWLSVATIEFQGNQSFDNVNVSGFGTVDADNSLTLGGNFNFSQLGDSMPHDPISATSFTGAGTILSSGTITGLSARDSGDGSQDSLLSFLGTEFDNSGIIDIRDISVPGSFAGNGPSFANFFNPGTSTGTIGAATFINEAGGTFEAGQSAGVALITIAASTNFTNNGMMLTQDASSVAGGTIDIAAILGGSGTIDLNGGGLVHLRSASSNTQNIDFVGAGTLTLDTPGFDPAIVNGFTVGDLINLGVSAAAISYTSGDLKLQTGGSTIDLDLTGPYSLSNFTIVAQSGTTAITVCFAAGTHLATTRGLVAVETLRVGDEMLLAGGGMRPASWIGHREVDCQSHSDPRTVWPVRVSAGSFADNVPACDLLLSPDHAVFVNGILIPVRCLINHRTITQRAVPRVEYWHVELPTHEVIMAEGLSVESLLPGTGREFFSGIRAAMPLWQRHTANNWEIQGCAPLVISGPALRAVQTSLLSRMFEPRQVA